MKKLMILLVAALGVSSLFAKCACPGDKLTEAPGWAPAPLKALTFETGGDAKWTTDKVVTNHAGKVSTVLRSGAIEADEKTWMQARVKGNGRLSFWWKSSCEEKDRNGNPADKLSFEVRSVCVDPDHCKCEEDDTIPCKCHGDCKGDGSHKKESGDWTVSGTNEWVNVIVDITDGQKYEDILDADGKKTGVKTNLVEHVVRWTYSKNASRNRFEDCGWVDDVIWARSLERDVTVTFDPNGGRFEGSVNTKPTFKFEMDDNGTIQPYYRDHKVQYTDEFGRVTNEVTVVDTRFPTNEIKKARFEFKGWYGDLKALDSKVLETDEVSPTNITLHAMWRQVESDSGSGLFEALDLDQTKDQIQQRTFRETLTTNDWLACRKGGVDDGDMAMSGKAYATFSTVVTNHAGTVGGADGAFSFWWKREFTNSTDTMKVKWECRKGIWCDGEVMSNGVMIAGFTPRWVEVSTDPIGTTEVQLKEEDRKGDPNDGWNFREFPTTENNFDEDVDKPHRWIEGGVTYSSSNCHKRVMFRKFSCTFNSSSDLHHGYVDRLAWTPINKVKVTFDANGGTVKGKPTYVATYPAGYAFDFEGVDSNLWNSASVTNKVAVGSKFAGWYDKQTGGERLGQGAIVPCTTSNLTYYAHWSDVSIADAIGQPGLDIGATPCCEDDKNWSGRIGDCPSNATSAAWCAVPTAGVTNCFWFTVSGEKFLSFRWFMDSLTGDNFDLFSVWVDGEMVARYGYFYNAQTEKWEKLADFKTDDWDTFYYYLKAGQHEVRVNYAADKGGGTIGYLTELELAKVDANDLIDWLDKLHCYGTWLTNKLDKFAAAYTNKFNSAKVDEVARARLGHAICTVLALGENPEVIAAAHDNGATIVEHYPFVATNFLNYVFGDYAPEEVIAHLNAIKGSTPNVHYERFSREAVAALNTAIGDLDAITNGWKGSFLLETTGKRIDMSGVACTNDLAVDLADINMVKANLQGMLSSVQFVGAHDMTINYDAVITSLTNRPWISRMPQMLDSQHNPIWAKRLLKATAENPLLDEDERARLSAYVVKTYGDGTDWDNVPALPLRSAPYAEIERSGSVKIAMCGGVSISAPPPPSNANRLMFLIESNERNELLAGKVIRATFIDEISGRPVVIRIALPAAPPAATVEPVIGGGYAGFTTAGFTPDDLLHGQGGFVVGDVQIYSDNGEDRVTVAPGLEYFGTVAQITLDLASCNFGEYFPVHWTILSVEVGTDTVNFNNGPAFLVGEHEAPSMTGNSNEWRNVSTYRISPLNAATPQGRVPGVIAESIQFVRNSSNVYFRLSRLNPQSRHTFESVHLTLAAQPEIDPAGSPDPALLNFDEDIDTTKVVFTGESVEFSVALPPEYDSAKLNRMTLTDLRCSCCAEDDARQADHPEENALTPFSTTSISVDEEMRWHSVRTHYEDFGTVLDEHPNFLKNLRDAALLANSKESMRAALTSFIAADAAMQVRKGEERHLFTYTNGVAEALADVRQAARDALLSLDGPQKVNFLAFRKAFRLINGGLFDRYLDGPGFRGMFVPEAMSYVLRTLDLRLEGDVAMDMSVLFKSGISRSFLPQFDGAWPVLDTMPDPTFGGIFPGMTLADWLGSYLGLGIISLDTYLEIYPQMAVRVPTHLKIRQYVRGEGYVNYITDLRAAMPGARISCAVDGIDQAVTEFAPSHVNCGVWIRGEGEHEVVWTIISGPLVEVSRGGAAENWPVDALWNHQENKYGEYWTIEAGGVAESFWPYRQNNTLIPIVAIEFSEGLKLIAKRRKGGSVDFGFDDDTPFVVGEAQTFQGELLEDGKVIGSVTVKVDKKGVVSATVNRMDGTKTSYKKGAINEAGIVEFEGGLVLTLGTNKLSGSIGEDLEIAGVRNVFASKDEADKAKAAEAMAKWENTYVFAMEAINPEEAGPFVNGYGVFTLTVGKNGKSKLQGFMPDGTKVSYSTQMLLGEEDAHVPLSVSLYKNVGGFGMDIVLGEESSLSVAGASGWKMAGGAVADWALAASGVAANSEPLPGPHMFYMSEAFAFEMDCCEEALPTEFRPEAVSVGSNGKWAFEKAAKVANVGGEWAIDDSKGSNLSGLKLSYKAATGLFKGTFVVYALEGGKVKKYKATVNGAEIEGSGYGSAVIKDKGVAPVMINMECDDCTP